MPQFVPADVVSDSTGGFDASGFTIGIYQDQPYSTRNIYRATPSKAGYTFNPASFVVGSGVTFVGTPTH